METVTGASAAEVFAARFLGSALPLVDDDPTVGVPVGAFCGHRTHVMAARSVLHRACQDGGERLLKKKGVVRLGPDSDEFAVHLTVAGASMVGDGCSGKAVVTPWAEIQELLETGHISWVPGMRLPTFAHWRDRPPAVQPAFTFCELFAGIGGFRLGLDAIGGHCVFASEIDIHAAATYTLNFGEAPQGDITECAGEDIPDIDLLTAGFPCQPFTTIGAQGGLSDLRGQLYREVCRIISSKRPRAFLLENVKNLYNVGGGRGHADFALREPGVVFLTILHALEVACGYTVRYELISSKPWVPQDRERLYIVGFRPDVSDAALRFRWPQPPEGAGGTVRDFLEDAACPAVRAAELTASQWANMQDSQTFRTRYSSRIVDLDGPARTLISSYKSGSAYYAEVLVEERDGSKREGCLRPRFFTARECCRAMGFPEDYRIPGDPLATTGPMFQDHQMFFHQIGNAVCAPVVTAIGVEILRALGWDNENGWPNHLQGPTSA